MSDYKRRIFLSSALTATVTLSLGLHGRTALAAEGYELIDPPQNTGSPDAVEVVEFFWLGCPHCYSFEPTIAAWKESKPANVKFIREAPPLNPSWEEHSRGFYAAQLMGQENAFVDAMFQAIHADRKRMRKPSDIAELAAELGLDKDKFLKTMKSFAVQTKLNRSVQLAKGAGISGVPSIVINGKYRTGSRLARGNAGMIDVINRTVAIEKQVMGLN
ncbi:MAG: thiol:disulfide interchange protein DsbA/DsbL [Granulosicoccus sp.]